MEKLSHFTVCLEIVILCYWCALECCYADNLSLVTFCFEIIHVPLYCLYSFFCGRSVIPLTFLFKGLFPLRAGRCRWRIAPESLHPPLKSSGAAYLPRIDKDMQGQKGQRMRS